jgi:hypothetical protein
MSAFISGGHETADFKSVAGKREVIGVYFLGCTGEADVYVTPAVLLSRGPEVS